MADPDQFFQNNRTDKVCRTASRIAAVVGAYKMILPLFKVVSGAVAHFCSTISAIYHAGKQAALARLCPAVPLLANFLHLVKDLLLNDRRVGVVENRLFFNGRFSLLLVPDGIGVGLEIDGASRVLPPFQNVNNRVGIPMVRISGFRAGCLDSTLCSKARQASAHNAPCRGSDGYRKRSLCSLCSRLRYLPEL